MPMQLALLFTRQNPICDLCWATTLILSARDIERFCSPIILSHPFTFGGDSKISKKIDYTVLRSKQFNLLRRPNYTTVESYYQTKLFSSQFLSFKATDKLNISLFEGSYWNVGDSISSKSVNLAYYVPLPFVGGLAVNNRNEVNSTSGIQLTYLPIEKLRIYGQLAMTNWNSKSIGSQIGLRYYSPFGLKEGLLQLEYNNIPKRLYRSENSQLHYSASNLPSAHPKGNGFQEFVLRFNFTKNRFYADVKSILFLMTDYESTNLIASHYNLSQMNGSIYHQQIELGYRVNRNTNLEVFLQHIYRNNSVAGESLTNAIYIGLRTGLINHYNDF
jgi:hypothetical protein